MTKGLPAPLLGSCDNVDEQPVLFPGFTVQAQSGVWKSDVESLVPALPAQALIRLREALVVDQEVDVLGLTFRSWQRHDRFDPGGTISLTPPDG